MVCPFKSCILDRGVKGADCFMGQFVFKCELPPYEVHLQNKDKVMKQNSNMSYYLSLLLALNTLTRFTVQTILPFCLSVMLDLGLTF